MHYVELGSSGLRSSVLGFGCAGVMGRVGRKDSLRALGAAYDAGVNFFDTARSYGYGESEALLGEFLAGRRNRAIISTKFGILAVPQQPWKQALKPLARTVFSIFPSAQRAAKAQIASQFQSNQFSVKILRNSLDESLRKLRTDYVDLLFMHSPTAAVMAQDDLFCEMENLVRAGKVRVAGISADPALVQDETVRQRTVLRALQFPCNLLNQEQTRTIAQNADGRILIGNLPFGGSEGRLRSGAKLRELTSVSGIAETLRRKLMDQDPHLLAEVALNAVTRHTDIHVVVPSMLQIEHVRANVQAITQSRFSDSEIAWIREALRNDNLPGARKTTL